MLRYPRDGTLGQATDRSLARCLLGHRRCTFTGTCLPPACLEATIKFRRPALVYLSTTLGPKLLPMALLLFCPHFLHIASQTMESLLLHLMRLGSFPIPTLSHLPVLKQSGWEWVDRCRHSCCEGRSSACLSKARETGCARSHINSQSAGRTKNKKTNKQWTSMTADRGPEVGEKWEEGIWEAVQPFCAFYFWQSPVLPLTIPAFVANAHVYRWVSQEPVEPGEKGKGRGCSYDPNVQGLGVRIKSALNSESRFYPVR